MEEIKLGKYRHFKGEEYEVVGFAKHSETLEKLVIYRSLENGDYCVRPIEKFLDKKSINDEEINRFTYIK